MQTTLDSLLVTFESLAINATAGSFNIRLGTGSQTLPFNASADQIQAALLQLPGIQAVTVTPTSPATGSAFTITFDRVDPVLYPNFNVPQLQLDTAALTGSASVQMLSLGGRQVKRVGFNQYAGDGSLTDKAGNPLIEIPAYASRALTFDFDSGTPDDNVFGDSAGLGAQESFTGRGDSGGPAFLDGKIVGIVSFGGTFFSSASSGNFEGRSVERGCPPRPSRPGSRAMPSRIREFIQSA